MNIEALTLLLKAHWHRLKTARDEGQGTTEVAVITAVVIVVAAGVALAIKTKVAEKVGIISGG
ncbi:hypothetical protein ACIOEW_36645 [Streptomyces sp. NPDC087901]|uniref:hypothetical protein n=1 Tax=unclassified Streptomyces TaxID=2593676 RepID=UPI00288B219A|nr:hypothetical protein [Streptomyces sp. ITFR-6]WNI34450.1 hypothetical protein RLT59_38195 [Streptomyces sp. ITFR-6]